MLLGNAAGQHPDSAALERLARWIAEQTGATFGWLGDGGNASVRSSSAPSRGRAASNAAEMLAPGAAQGGLLLNVEPVLDLADPPRARRRARAAQRWSSP